MIKINELKIGDRVKYNLRGEFLTGKITQTTSDASGFNILEDGKKHSYYVHSIYINNYLEPLPPQYKEIEIERVDNYGICQCCGIESEEWLCDRCSEVYPRKIRISDLKVGDKIRYKTNFFGKETIDFGIINSGEDNYGYFRIKDIKGAVDLTNAEDKGGIHKKHFISKILELGEIYKEIPIEKEDNFCICLECGSSLNKPYICEKCKNKQKLGAELLTNKERNEIIIRCFESANAVGLTTSDINRIINKFVYVDIVPSKIGNIIKYICVLIEENNKKKEKSAPKSFKFDISYINRVEFDQSPYRPGEFPSCFFKINGCNIKYYPDNPDIMDMNGKTYTIEIKEKE